jgi:hypothetical protein
VAEGKVGLSDYRREGDLPSNDVETGNQFNYSGQVFHMGPLDGYDPAAGGSIIILRLEMRSVSLFRSQGNRRFQFFGVIAVGAVHCDHFPEIVSVVTGEINA